MEIITSLGQLHKATVPCVVALGTFDGLHLGHQDVIRTAKEQAERTGAKLAVFTFSNHPYALIRPDMIPPALITPKEKQQLLEAMGVDILIDIPFNAEVAQLTPQYFVEKLQDLGYDCLVVGENFTYGVRGEGNVHTLEESAQKLGFRLIVRHLVMGAGAVVSSTAIRQLIAEGKVEQAAKMLGRAYRLSGIVAHGNERGRLLGYPTANLELENAQVAVPLGGVYAVRAYLADSSVYGGMANIGSNPTFGDVAKPRLETNIFDFSGNLYEQPLTIEFVARIRGEVKFNGLEALKAQLAADKEAIRRLL